MAVLLRAALRTVKTPAVTTPAVTTLAVTTAAVTTAVKTEVMRRREIRVRSSPAGAFQPGSAIRRHGLETNRMPA